MSVTSVNSSFITYSPSESDNGTISQSGTFDPPTTPDNTPASSASSLSAIHYSQISDSSINGIGAYPPDALPYPATYVDCHAATTPEEAAISQSKATQPAYELVKNCITRIFHPFQRHTILHSADIYTIHPVNHTSASTLYVGKEIQVEGLEGVVKGVHSVGKESVCYLFKPNDLPRNQPLHVVRVDACYASTSTRTKEAVVRLKRRLAGWFRIKRCSCFLR